MSGTSQCISVTCPVLILLALKVYGPHHHTPPVPCRTLHSKHMVSRGGGFLLLHFMSAFPVSDHRDAHTHSPPAFMTLMTGQTSKEHHISPFLSLGPGTDQGKIISRFPSPHSEILPTNQLLSLLQHAVSSQGRITNWDWFS